MATLYPNILVVMLNFREQTQEATLLEQIVSLARLKRNEIEKDETIARLAYRNLEGLLAHLIIEYDLYVVFFGDEIQTLFRREAASTDDTVKTMCNLITIGKSKYAFAVLSGTASNTEELAFQAARRPEYKEYPSLNETVYRISRISPFREKSKLKELLSIVYPAVLFDDSDIDSIFSATGGVGRAVMLIRGKSLASVKSDRKQMMLSALRDTDFAMVITALYIQSEESKSTMWNPLRVKKSFFLEDGITIDQFHEWQDKSLLFLNLDSLEFMCYDDKSNLKEIFANDNSIWIELALRVSLMGWQGKSCDDFLKSFLCEKLIEKKYIALRNATLSYKKRVLRCADSLTGLTENNDEAGKTVTMNDINGELLSIKSENGLYGVVFEIANTTDQEVVCNLYVLQIKIGACYKKITAGSCYSTGDDTTMTCIYDKAQNGLKVLANYLARVGTTRTIRISNVHFTLLTSKHVDEAALQYTKTADLRWNGAPMVTVEVKDKYYFRQLDSFIDDTYTKYENNKIIQRPSKKRN